MDSLQVGLLLLRLELHLLLLHSQAAGRFLKVGFLLFNFFFQCHNLFIVFSHSLLQLVVSCFLLEFDLSLECLDTLLDLVEGHFFDKDFLFESTIYCILLRPMHLILEDLLDSDSFTSF